MCEEQCEIVRILLAVCGVVGCGCSGAEDVWLDGRCNTCMDHGSMTEPPRGPNNLPDTTCPRNTAVHNHIEQSIASLQI